MVQLSGRIRVLIVDDVPETRENLRKLLSFAGDIEVVGAAASGAEGIEMAREFQPHVVLMDINMPGMDGIAATEAVLQVLPNTQVVILSVQGETDYLRRAMTAGARDFLTKPPGGDELMSTIRRVYETGMKRGVVAPGPAAGPAQVRVERKDTAERQGDVVAIYSPKGGVGCTTIAVNLSIALQQVFGGVRKVALLDANLQFGDVSVMLDLRSNRTIADLAEHLGELDADLLGTVLAAHGSGVKVMLAPPHPEAAEGFLAAGGGEGESPLKTVLHHMCRSFDIVITDMGSRVDDIALTIFDMARMIVLVVMPNIPSIKNARLFLEVARRLDYPTEEIALVLNCVDRRTGIGVEQIERALMPVVAQIPFDDQAALTAANSGAPFVIRDQSRPISQGIMGLAQHIRGALGGEEESEEPEEEPQETMLPGTGRLRLGRLFR